MPLMTIGYIHIYVLHNNESSIASILFVLGVRPTTHKNSWGRIFPPRPPPSRCACTPMSCPTTAEDHGIKLVLRFGPPLPPFHGRSFDPCHRGNIVRNIKNRIHRWVESARNTALMEGWILLWRWLLRKRFKTLWTVLFIYIYFILFIFDLYRGIISSYLLINYKYQYQCPYQCP